MLPGGDATPAPACILYISSRSKHIVLQRPGPVLVQQPATFSLLAVAHAHVQGAAGQYSRLNTTGCHLLLSNPA